jgi:hypothetical protein
MRYPTFRGATDKHTSHSLTIEVSAIRAENILKGTFFVEVFHGKEKFADGRNRLTGSYLPIMR